MVTVKSIHYSKKYMRKILFFLSVIPLVFGPLFASAYTIKKGDTLSQIAYNHGLSLRAIVTLNPDIENPNLIFPGQEINTGHDDLFGGPGGAYSPVSGFKTRTTQYIGETAATIPVASIKDQGGSDLTFSDVSGSSTVNIYFTIEPGSSREEIVKCTGRSGNSLTTCTRGLTFQGGLETASTTLDFAHNAGSVVVISNVGQFYGQYVSLDGTQYIDGRKIFNTLPRTSSTASTPANNADLVSKYYVDNTLSTGFSAANVSSTGGLKAITSGVPNCQSASTCVAVNVSSTGGIMLHATSGEMAFSGIVNTSTIFNGEAYIIGTPATSTSITNWMFQQGNAATGTAGTSTSPGQALYISSTGTLFLTSTAASNTVYEYVGIALSTTTVGGVVTYARPGGTALGWKISGLTQGASVYLGDASGTVGNTLGTIPARIGRALNSTTVLLQAPSFQAATSASYTVDVELASTKAVDTTWQPTRVDLFCEMQTSDPNVASVGAWMRNSNGTTQQSSVYSSSTSAVSFTSACTVSRPSGVTITFTVATTTSGFSIANSAGGVNGENTKVQYFASYADIYPSR